jgi:ATP-dependent RNA circularization protein (DNA/RNA ligase family)
VEFLRNVDWIWTEKIDGTNISVVWDGHKVQFHGRTERAQIPAHLVNKLNEMFGGETNEQLFEQAFGETPMILYGEGYGPKIQNGGSYREDVSFILFDVYKPEGDIWLKRDAVVNIAAKFGIDVVPVIYVGNLANAVRYVRKHPASTIGDGSHPMEGLVGRPMMEMKDRMGRRVIVKVKARDFE